MNVLLIDTLNIPYSIRSVNCVFICNLVQYNFHIFQFKACFSMEFINQGLLDWIILQPFFNPRPFLNLEKSHLFEIVVYYDIICVCNCLKYRHF